MNEENKKMEEIKGLHKELKEKLKNTNDREQKQHLLHQYNQNVKNILWGDK